MNIRNAAALFLITACIFTDQTVHAAVPDTLVVFNAAEVETGTLPDNWEHILPRGDIVYTNYSVERSIDGRFLRARTSGTSSYLELDVGEIDPEEYSTLRWQWKADSFPAVEWERNPDEEDFVMRIELVYDFKGSVLNFFNIVRKGFLVSLFRWYPPQRIISYVWAVNVPIGEPFQSSNEKNTTFIPIESTKFIINRWITEEIDIYRHIADAYTERKLYLKKIRIRADTDNTGVMTESGIKFISLIRK
jgi:hypothetical protein